LSSAIDDGQVAVNGDVAAVKTALAIFEVEGLRS